VHQAKEGFLERKVGSAAGKGFGAIVPKARNRLPEGPERQFLPARMPADGPPAARLERKPALPDFTMWHIEVSNTIIL
jgi:hypothetical protein